MLREYYTTKPQAQLIDYGFTLWLYERLGNLRGKLGLRGDMRSQLLSILLLDPKFGGKLKLDTLEIAP